METWKIKGAICDNLGITILRGRIGSHHVVIVLQQLSCHLSGPTNRLEELGHRLVAQIATCWGGENVAIKWPKFWKAALRTHLEV